MSVVSYHNKTTCEWHELGVNVLVSHLVAAKAKVVDDDVMTAATPERDEHLRRADPFAAIIMSSTSIAQIQKLG